MENSECENSEKKNTKINWMSSSWAQTRIHGIHFQATKITSFDDQWFADRRN